MLTCTTHDLQTPDQGSYILKGIVITEEHHQKGYTRREGRLPVDVLEYRGSREVMILAANSRYQESKPPIQDMGTEWTDCTCDLYYNHT